MGSNIFKSFIWFAMNYMPFMPQVIACNMNYQHFSAPQKLHHRDELPHQSLMKTDLQVFMGETT